MCLDSDISSQFLHLFFKQLFFSEFPQFKDFAKILAIVVLPTPLIPVNKKALGILIKQNSQVLYQKTIKELSPLHSLRSVFQS